MSADPNSPIRATQKYDENGSIYAINYASRPQMTTSPVITRQTVNTSQPINIQNNLASQTYIQGSQPLITGSQVRKTNVRNLSVVNSQAPVLTGSQVPILAGSQVNRVTYQTLAGQSSARPLQVFTATGPPVPPLQASTVRTPMVQTKYVYDQNAVNTAVANRPITQGHTTVETVLKQRHDPLRQSRRPLYQSKGYVDNKKGCSPCLLALLGLLGLAGLLTGLYFLIRAINAGTVSQPAARTNVNYIENGTTSGNSSITINGSTTNSSNLSPIIIDVQPNTTVKTNTTTNTSATTTTTSNNTSTNTNVVNPVLVPATTTTTNGTITTNSGSTTTTNTGGSTSIINTTSTTGTSGTTSTTGLTTGTTTVITGTNSTTTSTTGNTTSSTTNTTNSVVTPIAITTNIPSTAVKLTSQQIASDNNVQLINNYLKQQDTRLGTNPILNNVYLSTVNGTSTYYFDYSNGSGKNYLYGVVIGSDGQPVVKTVSVSQTTTTTTTTAHLLKRHTISQKGNKIHNHQIRAMDRYD